MNPYAQKEQSLLRAVANVRKNLYEVVKQAPDIYHDIEFHHWAKLETIEAVEEFLLAAEYVLDQGNQEVVLCERGIRTFETHTRFTLPLATVPYVQQRTHLPIVVDPSHGTGHTSLVTSMAKAAIAAGADGLIIEIHPNPDKALSDGYQSLNFAQFDELMNVCRRIADAVDRVLGAAVAV